MKEYQLIDSGGMAKLEQFGSYRLIRPEAKALWERELSHQEWRKMADAQFDEQSGKWRHFRELPKEWPLAIERGGLKMKMLLSLTSYKHVGLFPEQLPNWEFIYRECSRLSKERAKIGAPQPKVLNLFAYTGAASLAAKRGGADVTHLDSVRQVVTWARRNMESSSLSDIRWIVEDALKFVSREMKRGRKYDGIVMDPPAFGYGRGGERWKLDEGLYQLLQWTNEILALEDGFLVLNLYSNGYTPLLAESVVKSALGVNSKECESGELFVKDRGGRSLPLGLYVRVKR